MLQSKAVGFPIPSNLWITISQIKHREEFTICFANTEYTFYQTAQISTSWYEPIDHDVVRSAEGHLAQNKCTVSNIAR